ncbi:MAG: hypothetical protein LUH42_06480, partial [Oscillospiraceae bacterium]|nr:hypothetical protein [Oscillospiraceae bacterium]
RAVPCRAVPCRAVPCRAVKSVALCSIPVKPLSGKSYNNFKTRERFCQLKISLTSKNFGKIWKDYKTHKDICVIFDCQRKKSML